MCHLQEREQLIRNGQLKQDTLYIWRFNALPKLEQTRLYNFDGLEEKWDRLSVCTGTLLPLLLLLPSHIKYIGCSRSKYLVRM